ncbi:hypothetical protein [Pectobacterium wasabiae]|uniref:hypothetical protein n=1 Tax=Pectobacterium wasabiae TaxID=55208 RepID=UPI00027AFEF3|nr:hypothetical protein [Pectobacterium wasabiae]AOR62608.1 hypothetical protein A7983_04870 [Pectobacterium wasabiae CFBP 3304]EJS93698.1 Hypothetical protein Y17_2950 [Pectobacterium wasabiae CFBP 3304]
MEQDIKDRRPIKARQTRWASYFARALQLRGFTPNAISLLSILFAFIASISFIFAFRTDQDTTTRLLLLVGAMAKQHRMAILTLVSLLALIVPAYGQWLFIAALGVILLGSTVTCINRTRQIMSALRIQG